MGKNGKNEDNAKIGFHVPRELWERFSTIAAEREPPVTLTALLVYSLKQFVEREEAKKSKRGA